MANDSPYFLSSSKDSEIYYVVYYMIGKTIVDRHHRSISNVEGDVVVLDGTVPLTMERLEKLLLLA
jgi:hypothetical protein